ncbi:hypothetical protein QW131_09255 [Roseibium salinum]|nr:hypothetical protein [Roseibium salinum]
MGARSREHFVDAVRAFDRVLISGAYSVPLYHVADDWVAHWKKRWYRPSSIPFTGMNSILGGLPRLNDRTNGRKIK